MIEACSKQHNNVKTAKPDGRGPLARGVKHKEQKGRNDSNKVIENNGKGV